ncbi:helix-turn-helix domain-containing protein [Flavobacteriaceae bacterium]|jgi:excisionase family DNA binding protein|nr:helix-turn-helix domain-containing protein [Flavobacteriaceae bacterium]
MDNKNILTVDEVISYTGFSQKQIYKLTSTRAIPHYKPSGRKLFFKKDELDEWITQGRVKPLSELIDESQVYSV